MYYYNLTLELASGIDKAVCGNFIGHGRQQIIASSGRLLTMWKVNTKKKALKMKKIFCIDVFGCIRSMSAFRPVDDPFKDYLIIGSDWGNISVFKYNQKNKALEKVLQKSLDSSMCSRDISINYLAVDLKGQAIMIGALENTKYAYVFSERGYCDGPMSFLDTTYDASTKKSLIYDIVAVDQKDDPQVIIFASLEAKYQKVFPSQDIEVPNQFVVFYQLNPSSKSIDSIPLDKLSENSNFLMSVPNDRGIMLCASNCILYLRMQHPIIRCPIPRRLYETTKRPIIFVCSTTCKLENTFFFLVQTEQGDIFRVTLQKDDFVVKEIQMKYFTTVPVASSLCFLNSCHLFVAAEFGNHFLYEIVQLEDDGPEFSSLVGLDQDETFFFLPVALKNLVVMEEIASLSPVLQLEMGLLDPGKAHLNITCGKGQNSTLRVLQRHHENYKNGSEIFYETSKEIKHYFKFTPRKFQSIPSTSNTIFIEADHNAFTKETSDLKKNKTIKETIIAAKKFNALFNDKENLQLALSGLLFNQLEEHIPNLYQCESGMWASAVTILDFNMAIEFSNSVLRPVEVFRKELKRNEAACSLSMIEFASQKDVRYILVGVVNKLELGKNVAQSGKILTYKIENLEFQFVHQTVVEDSPLAICPFRGCVLISVGGSLKLYDFSEVMLYIKYEVPNLCRKILTIHTVGSNYIYVGDVKNGLLCLLYNTDGDRETIEVFAKSSEPSWITTTCFLDDNKLAIGDKLGNIFIVNLPAESINNKSDVPEVLNELLLRKHKTKIEIESTFHVGEIVCSLHIGDFSSHRNSRVLTYATLSGSIGILAPLQEDEVELQHFEMLMRAIVPPICGGDHLGFRSSYYSLLNVIDGDILEQFYSLSKEDQAIIESNIGKSPSEILEKIRVKYLG